MFFLFFYSHIDVFSQPSIYIDGWLYAMSMTSVVCVTFRCCLKTIPHIIILSSRHESDIPSLPGRPSFIILVWGASPPNRGKTVFACLQNSRKMENRNSVNKFRHRYSMLWQAEYCCTNFKTL